jgi:hypothetical protein
MNYRTSIVSLVLVLHTSVANNEFNFNKDRASQPGEPMSAEYPSHMMAKLASTRVLVRMGSFDSEGTSLL